MSLPALCSIRLITSFTMDQMSTIEYANNVHILADDLIGLGRHVDRPSS
jgi:hypothetical protein